MKMLKKEEDWEDKMFKFEISNEFKKISLLQLTGSTEDSYLDLCISEYDLFENFIENPKRILDLGCGLGRMSIFLNSQLQDPNIHYILADSTFDNKKPSYGWDAKEGFYNNLDLTEKFSINHGLENFEILDLKKNKLIELKDIDLIMSFLSVGFHYRIENYIDNLLRISTNDCTMIFGIRRNKYSENDFKKYFNKIEILPNFTEINKKRTKEDIIILQDRKDKAVEVCKKEEVK